MRNINSVLTKSQNARACLTKTGISVILAASLIIPVATQAAPSRHQGCDQSSHSPDASFGKMAHNLNLTDSQEEKLSKLMDRQKPRLRDNQKLINTHQKQLFELVTNPTFDEAKAEQQTQAIGKAMASNMMIRAETAHQLYQSLDKDQQKKFAEHQDQFNNHHKHRGPH